MFTFFLSIFFVERKVQHLEVEVRELEAENQSLQAALEELRLSTRRLEQLEAEKQSLEQEITASERDKRQLEKENRRLRQQVEGPVFKDEKKTQKTFVLLEQNTLPCRRLKSRKPAWRAAMSAWPAWNGRCVFF